MRIEVGEESITSTIVLQEVVNWLEYNGRRREVKAFMTAMNSYFSMRKIVSSWGDMLSALDYMAMNDVGYMDVLTFCIMKKYNVNEIYSNDKNFDGINWVKRIWD